MVAEMSLVLVAQMFVSSNSKVLMT
jgi:hypothetical protein